MWIIQWFIELSAVNFYTIYFTTFYKRSEVRLLMRSIDWLEECLLPSSKKAHRQWNILIASFVLQLIAKLLHFINLLRERPFAWQKLPKTQTTPTQSTALQRSITPSLHTKWVTKILIKSIVTYFLPIHNYLAGSEEKSKFCQRKFCKTSIIPSI